MRLNYLKAGSSPVRSSTSLVPYKTIAYEFGCRSAHLVRGRFGFISSGVIGI